MSLKTLFAKLDEVSRKAMEEAAGLCLVKRQYEVDVEHLLLKLMEDGTGDRTQGAPNLADAVWLYGSDPQTIRRMVQEGPYGVMPAWSSRLSEADIRAVAAYVHGLGGGE